MKVERIDRIYVYVRDLEKAAKFFADLFGIEFSDPAEWKEMDVRTRVGDLGIVLAEPLTPDGIVSKTIERRGEGVAMVALKVESLEEAVTEMKSRGISLVGTLERGRYKAALFHPKDTYGVMLDLCEYKEKHPILSALSQ